MSLNGSGVFNVNSAGQPVVAGTLNTAAAFNAYTADVAAALSTALYKDGQQLNAANQNMGGYKLTNLAAGSVAGDSLRYEQGALRDAVQIQGYSRFTAGGPVNAMTGTLSPAISSYVAGLRVTCIPNLANTSAAATIDLNSLGAKSIKKRTQYGGKTDLAAGDYNTSGPCDLEYDGTDFILLGPLSSSTPAGTVIDFAGASPPAGYLTCPTSETYVSATTYRELAFAVGGQWGAGSTTVNAGSFTTGDTYIIKATGTTDFTLIGASANTVGLAFTATGAGSGTGSAYSDFILPWFAADYAAVQANSNVGSSSVGQVIAHLHAGGFTAQVLASGGGTYYAGSISANTGSTGGGANLAAGVRLLKCVKY